MHTIGSLDVEAIKTKLGDVLVPPEQTTHRLIVEQIENGQWRTCRPGMELRRFCSGLDG